MARTLFFRVVRRKSSEITSNKPIFSQYNIFYNYEYLFFQNFKEFNQIRNNVVCVVAPLVFLFCCDLLRAVTMLLIYFRKLKEVGVLRPIFPDYGISCDYGLKK